MAEGQNERDELVYLDYEDALEIFAAIIRGSTQQAADRLRSAAALAGVLGRPAIYEHYERADVAFQAAVLADGMAAPTDVADQLRPRCGFAFAQRRVDAARGEQERASGPSKRADDAIEPVV